MCEGGVPGGALNLNSTGYPDRGRYGDVPLQGRIPMAKPGIEPGTSCFVFRRSDHQATRLVTCSARTFTTSKMCVYVRSNNCRSSQFISKIRSELGRKLIALSEIDYWINFHACHVNVLLVWPELRQPQFSVTQAFPDCLTPTQTALYRTINTSASRRTKLG
jgi:hypothetical protein